MGTRAYASTLARFATPEPLGVVQTWNEHDALAGDPINMVDANGLSPTLTDVDEAAAHVSAEMTPVAAASALLTLGCIGTLAPGGPLALACGSVLTFAAFSGTLVLVADAWLWARDKGTAGSVVWDALSVATGSASGIATGLAKVVTGSYGAGFSVAGWLYAKALEALEGDPKAEARVCP